MLLLARETCTLTAHNSDALLASAESSANRKVVGAGLPTTVQELSMSAALKAPFENQAESKLLTNL